MAETALAPPSIQSDPILVAISEIGSSCPAMATYLETLFWNGQINFGGEIPSPYDAITTYNIDASDNRIDDGQETIDLREWLRDDPSALVYMLRHEFGHAGAWAHDDTSGVNGYETSC